MNLRCVFLCLLAGLLQLASLPSVNAQSTHSLGAGTTEVIKVSLMVNGTPYRPPGGVPSILSPVIFTNNSTKAAQVYAYVSTPTNAQNYQCGSDPRPTSVDVNIWPTGQLGGATMQLPMNEHLTVQKADDGAYCWAEMHVGPLFIPPGYEMKFNIVYSNDATIPYRHNVNVNGFYMD
jgi:hypothetical protein